MQQIQSHPRPTCMVILRIVLLGILTLCIAFVVFVFYNRLDLLFRPLSKDFDSAITQEMQAAQVPGAAVLFIRKGQVESAKGFGIADIETGRMVTTDTMFTIASISKTITATALMTLYEQGKFALDDDINQYLPFTVRNPNFPDIPITFRMLLSHTSSIKDSNVYSQYYTLNQTPVLPDSPIPLGEYLKDYLSPGGKLYNAKDNFLVAAPGTTYTYTNTGFGLVGYLTERISGIPFDQYCKQAVFEPLGMQHSAWFFKDVNTNRMAIPYGYNDLLRQPKRFGFYGYPTYPDGALKTSVNEFARFLSVFINEGKTFEGETFLQPETVREMLAPHHFPGMDSGTSVGLAWHFDGDNYSHDGGDPGIDTYTFFNPNTDKGVIFFSNGTDVSSSSPPTIIRGLYFEILIPTLLTTKMNNP